MTVQDKLIMGNQYYIAAGDRVLREDTAENGQHPYAIVICCSDSRVIPEQIFSASVGDLFVIRVAGNVLDKHQMGSVEYAAVHLGCSLILLLGHTRSCTERSYGRIYQLYHGRHFGSCRERAGSRTGMQTECPAWCGALKNGFRGSSGNTGR